MKHARKDYNVIQDVSDAIILAKNILAKNGVITAEMKELANKFLSQTDYSGEFVEAINILHDEPVFLIRAKDICSGDAVRAWIELAKEKGASEDILKLAEDHAKLMDAWPVKKTPDVTGEK